MGVKFITYYQIENLIAMSRTDVCRNKDTNHSVGTDGIKITYKKFQEKLRVQMLRSKRVG